MFLAVCAANVIHACAQVHVVPIDKGWVLHEQGSERMIPATVPGSVQAALVRDGSKPDPLTGSNATAFDRIADHDWIYGTVITADSALLAYSHAELVFHGLDTYAQVYLNDSLLLTADNMFRIWRVMIHQQLHPGDNDLRVVMLSPIKEGIKRRGAYGIQLPADNDQGEEKPSPYIRKAAYQFGWDFAPPSVTMGIWKPVEMHYWDGVRITGIELQYPSTQHAGQLAFDVLPTIEATDSGSWTMRVLVNGVVKAIRPYRPGDWISIAIDDLKRWWPRGQGAQVLYDITVEAWKGGRVRGERHIRSGFRTVELDQRSDASGTAFTFVINGSPVFMKGCNLIPPALDIADASDSTWTVLVDQMASVGMNMVRVWGGGVYPPDAFFARCDSLGIMVWQDLMFANLVPGDSSMLENIRHEVIDQVSRIRHHPSLALWCGNNELDVAWKNWGWQRTYAYSSQDSTRIRLEYLDLFEHRIPHWIGDLGKVPYTPSSPLSNWGSDDGLRHGSLHYWGVWHGDSTFSSFAGNVGRFVSEYGFQSYPDSATLARSIDPSQLHLGSTALAERQRSYKTDRPIWEAIDRTFRIARATLGEFVVLSQLAQAEAYRQAIWAHRSGQPHCMGTLFWQLNDVWAAPTWSTIDHLGKWKAAMYEVQRSYRPLIMNVALEAGDMRISVLNDGATVPHARINMSVFDGNGIMLHSSEWEMSIRSHVDTLASLPSMLISRGTDLFVMVRLVGDTNTVLAERAMHIPASRGPSPPRVRFTSEMVSRSGRMITYRIGSDRMVCQVKVDAGDGRPLENYFPLRPKESRLVVVEFPDQVTLPPTLSLTAWPGTR